MYFYIDIKKGDLDFMQNEKDAQIKNAIISEIEAFQRYYSIITDYLGGKEYDILEMKATLEVFKEALDHISSHILTLYVLKGQKTKVTWQQLIENLENATKTMQTSQQQNLRSTIELAFNLSQPNAQEVVAYLVKLKESLQS